MVLFNAALELPDAERAAYLEKACAGDARLLHRLLALLGAHTSAGDFLGEPALARTTGMAPGPFRNYLQSASEQMPGPAEKTGDQIGCYKLLEPIGEGGCGVVYLAEQEKPVRRRVALKVIKLGMDTKSVIARFEAERQALALMDHPNIAKVLDAGATDTGRPFIVMELVRGTKITEYCDADNVSAPARLELFVQVCRAVQHAHQKGIIHRDLKPANILVAVTDGVPTPKVIDFGIAKATQGKLGDKTVFTAFEQFIGTPAYMSPEQAELGAVDIDTRSDIYSLGVLLYELLTGQTPFDARELLQTGLDEMRRQIRERQPAKPSTRLRNLRVADLTTVAGQRQAQPLKLIQLVRGDLDWMVMKCLEKDRARRYETANGLAADIQRHLRNEPVMARPPSKVYALQKLVRRHKLVFLGAGLATASLVFALAVAVVALTRIQRDDRRVRLANDEAVEKLRTSYLAEARALRMGGQSGGRFESLATVQKAAAIRPDLAARNEFIAGLAVSDMSVAKQKVMTGHTRNELANFDLDLKQYAFGATNGNITVWSASNDVVTALLPAPGFTFEGIESFSPDGKYLSARYSRTDEGHSFWVWDVARRTVAVHAIQQPAVTNQLDFKLAGTFSADSRLFFSSRADGQISIFDLPTGQLRRVLPDRHPSEMIAANPDATRLACSNPDAPQVEIRDLDSGQTVLSLACPAVVTAIAWSDDGRRVATACGDLNIHVWDAATGQQLSALAGHTILTTTLAFNHAGNLLASTGFDGFVCLWDVDGGRQLATHRGGGWHLHFSPDDLYLLGWQDGPTYGSLAVGYSRECQLLHVAHDHEFISLPAFSANGRLVAATTDGQACFWDTSSGREIGSFRLQSGDGMIFPPDGRSLISVDRIEGIRQRTLEPGGGARGSAWRLGPPRPFFDAPMLQNASLSQDGRHLAVTQQTTGQSFIFDLQNPSAKVVLNGHPRVNRIAVSPDGRWAATGSWLNPLVKIWDARSGACLRAITEPARTWPAFSPDGRWLATSSSEYQLLSVESWQPKGPPQPGLDFAAGTFTAFSPDSRVMARTEGHKIHLLNTVTEEPLATLEAPGSSLVARCQFSPDGTQLAAAQADQQVQLWDLRLIRQELAQVHLDWELPPYPPADPAAAAGSATLEIESDTNSTAR